MKRLICILLLLGLCFGCAGAEEQAEEAQDSTNLLTLLADLSALAGEPSDEALAQLDTDTAAMANPVAVSVSKNWKEVWLDPDYRLYLFGKDDPAQLPVTGKHAFLVLGYALQDGEMTEELIGRCDAAAAAAKAFPESLIVCSGGATGTNNPEGHTEAGLMKVYLSERCGIDPDRIRTDETAMTTAENAVNAFGILKSEGVESVTIVTSSYHQKRGMTLFHALSARFEQEQNYGIRIIGNYCYEIQPEGTTEQAESLITVFQLAQILTWRIGD